MAGFLNIEDEDDDDGNEPKVEETTIPIGSGLLKKKKTRANSRAISRADIEAVSSEKGFDRRTSSIAAKPESETSKRGRPPLNEDMCYWRIYIKPALRKELSELSRSEGRRLNDLLEDMRRAYVSNK